MTKRTFNPFRLEDLTGGINTRDYASEIEDKQSVNINNWNFKGNKLVNGPGIEKLFTIPSTDMIRGLTVDGDDIWHIQYGNLYKNGEIKYYNNEYILNVSAPANKIFSISIDGNILLFNISGIGYSEFETDLEVFLTSLGTSYNYEKITNGEYRIYKSDGTPILFTRPAVIRELNFDDWSILSKGTITIDGLDILVENKATNSDAINYIISQLPASTYETKIETGKIIIARLDGTAPVITWVLEQRYTYSYQGKSGTPGKAVNNDYEYEDIFGSGGTGTPTVRDTFIEIDGTRFTFTNDFSTNPTQTNFSVTYSTSAIFLTYNKQAQWAKLGDDIYNNLGAGYTVSNLVISSDNSTNDLCRFDLHKTDYAKILFDISPNVTFVNETGINPTEFTPSYVMDASAGAIVTPVIITETPHIPTLSTGVYTETVTITDDDNGIDILLEDKYQITISSIGILLTGTRAFNPVFIDNDGVANTLTSAVVGRPTIGTIYNGKIILGGYEGTDNIVFSQTYNPQTETNEMLNFTDYSAGAQSISGGNKGTITGFMVGENGLYVFKEDGIWYSNSEKDTGTSFNFIFNKITSTGTCGQDAIAEVGQEIFYFDYKNRALRRLGYEQNLTTLRDTAISREIGDIFEAIPDNNETTNDRFSRLINLSYKYPYLEVNYPNLNAPYIYIASLEENKYRVPNKTLVYNVENKSWAKRSDKEYKDKYSIVSHKGIFGTDGGDIYSSISGNTTEIGDTLSKEYTYGDDISYKKYGRFDIVGKIIPDTGEEKTFTVDVVIDDEIVDTRTITADTTTQIREKIDLYNIGQKFQFKLGHSGLGSVEIYDVTPYIKPTTIQPQDYS